MEMNDFLPMSLTVTRGGEKEVITVSESVTTFFAPAGSGRMIMKFSVPIVDIVGYWHTNERWPINKLHWNISVSSSALRFWPLLTLFNSAGINRFTFTVSERILDCDMKVAMNQADAAYIVTLEFPVSRDKDLEFDLYIDTQPTVWPEAVRRSADFCDKNVYEFPEAAWEPVFCSWYLGHAAIDHKIIEESARRCAELGFKTYIVDDGWCFDTYKRVDGTPQPWYCDIGDWEVSRKKFPDFEEHIERIHAMGMKYMLWTTPFLVGVNSKFFAEHKDGFGDIDIAASRIPDFHNREVCERAISNLVRLVETYNIDGLKVDFIDKPEPSLENPTGEAGYEFVRELSERLRKVKPDCMIEFRESYAHKSMLPFGTQFRCGDVPLDWMDNLRRLAKIIMELGDGVPRHADPAYWNDNELPENISRHMISAIAGVPMLSVDLSRQSGQTLEIIADKISFYNDHIEIYKKGHWEVSYFGFNLTWVKGSCDDEAILIVLDEKRIPELREKTTYLFNLSSEYLTFDNAEYFDCAGKKVSDAVPPGGKAVISR